MVEEINQIKNKIVHPMSTFLNMKRVPKEAATVFKKWANDEFVGDYGMAFKYLVDKVLIEPQPYMTMNEVLKNHESRLNQLEKTPEPEKPKRRMINGRGLRETNEEKKEDE